MKAMRSGNETQRFIFYVAQDMDASVKEKVKRLVNGLAESRGWSIAPPLFIDEIDEGGFELLGGALEIYSALPPNIISLEADLRSLEEVEEVIGAVRDLSRKEKISFECYLGSEYVGGVEDGVVDRLLQEGLIMPWRSALNRRERD